MASASLTLPAPAKINLALHVVGRRDDGYHLVETLAVFARFGDELSFTPASEDGFEIDGPFSTGLPGDDGNLVVRARDLLRRSGLDGPPVAIRLTKNLPVASGVGGGSSDAAATLAGLARLWAPSHDEARLRRLGAALGADVPMCLAARPLIARGVGERLEPLDQWPPLDLVLVNPGVAVSTPAVFGALARRDNPPLPPLPANRDAKGGACWLRQTRNDLEAPARALAPSIGAALDALRSAGAGFARMSGSGATCFGLFASAFDAAQAAKYIARDRPGWFVKATTTTGTRP